MENFDKKIKESLSQHELPLDAGAWASMEQALDKAMPVGGSESTGAPGSSWGWYAAGGSFLVASGVALFSLLSVNENNIGNSFNAKVQQPTEATTETSTGTRDGSENATISNKTEQPPTQAIASKAEKIGPQNGQRPSTEESVSIQETDKTRSSIVSNSEETSTTSENSNKVSTTHKGFLLGFTPSSREVCAGETVTFLNNTSEENIDFSWNFGDGTTSSETDPNHVFSTAGSYDVTLIGTRIGTSITEDQSINILVKQAPKAEILSSVDEKVENLLTYETLLTSGQSAEWHFSDGTLATGSKVNHLYLDPGVQKVKLTIKNSNGCSDRIELNESISEELEFYVGNTFTPDGDGSNDDFFIPVLRELNVPFQLIVVDKDNQPVFTTTNANEAWNGKHLNTGAPLPNGKYSYMLTLNKAYLKNNIINGKLNLLRR